MNERCLGWFLDQHQEQGLFPPNGYFNDELIHYDEEHDPQHNNPLLTYDWTKELKKYFNDVVWVYYFDRVVFYDENKFPYDQPVTTYNNLRKQIAMIINSKAYTYSKLWETTQLEYNPLWNVDGTTETVRELKQTGTDTNARSGSDTSTDSGSDVTTGQKTTYDTSFLDTDKSTLQHGLSNTTQYGSQNQETRNLTDKETITVTRSGNIGVTMSTQLIDAERETDKFDVYKWIVNDIVNQITYGIY